nr:WhiB family transcriptional regulator [Glycomyces sp. L485]
MDGRDYLADLLGNVPEWQVRALCAQTDPEAFFPEKGGSTRDAKRICARCEVKENCLQYALEHDERFGIWGGLSERERRKIKRQAREAARRRAERAMPVVVCMPTPMINPELEPQTALVPEPMPVGSVLAEERSTERDRVPVAA